MKRMESEERLRRHIQDLISGYLETQVIEPTSETVTKDALALARLGELLHLVYILRDFAYEDGLEFDKDQIGGFSKEELDEKAELLSKYIEQGDSNSETGSVSGKDAEQFLFEVSSRKYLIPYLVREINWIIVTILSASYVSSLVLMRVVFELVIGIASKNTGSMTDRINSILFFGGKERSALKKQWSRLCAWGHPYEKWVKEVCPIYVGHKPLYHPRLCQSCVGELGQLVDLFATVFVAKYELNRGAVLEKMQKKKIDAKGFSLLKTQLSV